MRYLLIILFSVFSLSAWSQSPPITTTKLVTTRQLTIPNDTLTMVLKDSGSLAFKGDTLYRSVPNGTTVCKWIKVNGSTFSDESFFGAFYNKTSWTSGTLASDFFTTGSTSVVGNKLQFSGGNGTLSTGSAIVTPSQLDQWKLSARVKVGTRNSTSYGFGLGKKSYNTYISSSICAHFVMTDGADNGKIVLYLNEPLAYFGISSDALSFSVNDYILMTCERVGYLLTVTARNVTTNSAPISVSYQYSTVSGNPGAGIENTGRYMIYNIGGTFTVDSLAASSNLSKNAAVVVIGDSKTQGAVASTEKKRYAALLNDSYRSTVILGGGGDRTKEVSARITEIIALHPKQALLAIGSNDIRQGAESPTVIYARYDSIANALIGAGVDVYHIPFYESSIDLSGLRNHIYATFPESKIINTYDATKVPGLLDGDGVHPNDAGMAAIYNAIVSSNKMSYGNEKYVSDNRIIGTPNRIPIYKGIELGDSKLYENIGRVYAEGPMESIFNNPGVSLFKTNAATDEKGWLLFSDATRFNIGAFADNRVETVTGMSFKRTGTTVNFISVPVKKFIIGALDEDITDSSVLNVYAVANHKMAAFNTNSSLGGYLSLLRSGSIKGYVGFGSVLTSGAGPNDMSVRTESDTLHITNHTGAVMASFMAGKLLVKSATIGSSSDSAWTRNPSTGEFTYSKINGGGTTNLTYTQNATNNVVSPGAGTSATLLTATSSLAGLLDTARAKFIDSARGRLIVDSTPFPLTATYIAYGNASNQLTGKSAFAFDGTNNVFTNTGKSKLLDTLFTGKTIIDSGNFRIVGDIISYQSGSISTSTGFTYTTGGINALGRNSATGRYEDITNNVVVSSASTLTLGYGGDYFFTGTTATYTLPAISAQFVGRKFAITIKNRGSGAITVNAASGSTIYDTAVVATINIAAGAAVYLMPDGTFINVE